MSNADWQELVRRFCPKDKRPCNCGDAWETWMPPESRIAMLGGEYVGTWACKYGCDANKAFTRDDIAGLIASGGA